MSDEPRASAPPPAATRAVTPVGWLLVRVGEEEAKVTLLPGEDFRVGRSKQRCAIALQDDSVAPQHAALKIGQAATAERDAWPRVMVRDFGSTNGVIVNGTHLPSGGEHTLRHRDSLHIGRNELVYIEAPRWPRPAEPELVRDPTLEAASLARPDDDDALAVWADWLQVGGSPLGELIALQLRKRSGDEPDALALQREQRQLLATHSERLIGALARCRDVHIGWRDGLVELLRCGEAEVVPLGAIEDLLLRPAALALRTLRARRRASGDSAALLGMLSRHGQAATVRAIDIALDPRHNTSAIQARPLSLAALADFAQLETLRLHDRVVGPTDGHATLRELEIECAHIERVLVAVAAGAWPALERLTLSRAPVAGVVPHAPSQPLDLGPLAPLLGATATPRLRVLALRDVIDDMTTLGALLGSTLAAQLDVLSVS